MASPLPKTNVPAFVKNSRICARTLSWPMVAPARSRNVSMPQITRIPRTPAALSSRPPRRPGPQIDDEQARQDEEGGQLGLRPDCRDQHNAEDAPENRVPLVGPARQAVGRDGDDGDDDSPDAVKESLHPGESPKGHIQPGQGEHHEEGRHNEGEPDQRGAQHPP